MHRHPLPPAGKRHQDQERPARCQYVARSLHCCPRISWTCLDSNGSVEHWHITSGKCLNAISNNQNQLYALDYRADGAMFATGGKDHAVSTYVTCCHGVGA